MKDISQSIAELLGNKKIIDKNDIDICRYGLEVFISSTLEILSILLISFFVGNFFETLLFFAAFIPLRIYAGGYHANTKLRCYITSVVVYGLFTILLYLIPQNIYVTVCFSEMLFTLIIVLLFSPVIHSNKNVNKVEIHNYRKSSIYICVLEIIIIIALTLILKNNRIIISLALGQLAESLAILTAILKKNMFDN